jgi:hypothetical protein
VLAGGRTLVEDTARLAIRGGALQNLRIAVFGHETWAGRRRWIREGVGFQPGVGFIFSAYMINCE